MKQTNHTPESLGKETTSDAPRRFVNIYRDEQGRFISDCDAESLDEALENRDLLGTYVETVEIIPAQQQTDKLYTREEVAEFLKSIIDNLPLYGNDVDGYWITDKPVIVEEDYKTPQQYVDEWFNQNYPK